MTNIVSNIYGIILEMKCTSESMFFFEDQEKNLTIYEDVKKVHKVNNHKKQHQLMISNKYGGWLTPDISKLINRVVKDCRICQKFKKLIIKPKVTLLKYTSFNEIVTLDLKKIGDK